MTLVARAGPADAPTIAELEARAAHQPWPPAAVAGSLALATTVAWIARLDGVAAGHLVTQEVAGEAEILTIATDPDHRRRGVASALLRAAEDRWNAHGVQRAFLDVRDDNAPARVLYRGRGWTEIGRRARYYPDGRDAVLLTWEPRC